MTSFFGLLSPPTGRWGPPRACGLVWPILDGWGSLDPSSNLGKPTNQTQNCEVIFKYQNRSEVSMASFRCEHNWEKTDSYVDSFWDGYADDAVMVEELVIEYTCTKCGAEKEESFDGSESDEDEYYAETSSDLDCSYCGISGSDREGEPLCSRCLGCFECCETLHDEGQHETFETETFEAPKTMTKLQAKKKVIALMKPYWLKDLKKSRGSKPKKSDEYYEPHLEDWEWWNDHIRTVETGKYAEANTGGDTILREALPYSYWAFINYINPTWEGSEKYDDDPYETMYADSGYGYCIYDRTTPRSEWSASDKRKLNKLEKRWEEEDEELDFFDYIDQKEAIEGKYDKTVYHKSEATKMNCKHCGPYFKNRANINNWDVIYAIEDQFWDYWEYPASLKKQVKALIPALKGIKPKPKARAKKAITKPKTKVAKKTTTRKAKPKAKAGRKAPTISATKRKIGTRMRGNDGKMWEVKKSGKSQRWMAGAEEEGDTSNSFPVIPVLGGVLLLGALKWLNKN